MVQADGLLSIKPVSLMIALRKIDKQHLAARDIVVLWFVKHNPGAMGSEIADKIGLASRTNVRQNIGKLAKHGFLEDRRVRKIGAVPNNLYITPAGEEFLDGLLAS